MRLHPRHGATDNPTMGRLPVARARQRRNDDSGFTLVEAVVSLFVLGIIFTALAMAAMGSIRASYNSRAEQQAIDFATEALEQARRADYYTLGHDVDGPRHGHPHHRVRARRLLRRRARGARSWSPSRVPR